MSLKKTNRLKKQKDFDLLKKKGKQVSTDLFNYVYLQEDTKRKQIGFVVSKKISKKAVARNKIRRRLSEAVRLLLPRIKPGVKAIFFVKQKIKNSSYQEIYDRVRDVIGNR